jgi:uncharacterized protein (TIGR01615 family)
MQRIPSLLFELELEGEVTLEGGFDGCECCETSEETYQLGYCTKLRTPLEQRVFGIVKYASQAYKMNSSILARKLDVTKFVACYLTLNGLTTKVRTAIGGGTGGECLQNLRHSYLICTSAEQPKESSRGNAQSQMMASSTSSAHPSRSDFSSSRLKPMHETMREEETVVIEPSFRDHFAVARPSKKYQKFYDSIPEVFVGSRQNLRKAVDLICEEIKRSFAEGNLPVPAWRKHKSLVSKWLPKKWEDQEIPFGQLREWGAFANEPSYNDTITQQAHAHVQAPSQTIDSQGKRRLQQYA